MQPPAPAPRHAERIAVLVHSLKGGGAQRRVATIVNGFVEAGRAVDFVTLDARGLVGKLLDPRVRVVPLLRGKALKGVLTPLHAPALTRYIVRERPDVLMSAATNTHALAIASAALAGRRRVPVVLRGSRHPERKLTLADPLRLIVEKARYRAAGAIYARADAVIAVSHGVAEGIRRFPHPPADVTTILNPVIGESFRATHDPLPDLDRPLIVGVGRFVRQKDFPTLLKAFAMMRADRPRTLALLGSGPDQAQLRALARKLGIERDLVMPGEVDTIASWLAKATMLVSSSVWEGLPAVLIEGLAAGCAVVATDSPGGSREILDDGRFGMLVPMRDPAAMARAMDATLDDPPDREHQKLGALPYVAGDQAARYLEVLDRCASSD